MSKQTLITADDPRGQQSVALFRAAYNRARLDPDRAQRLNERGGELQDGIAKLIAELTTSDRFADEEVASSYTYPKEYQGPKPIAEQTKAIAKIFDLDPAGALEYANNLPALESFVPKDALGWTGWFAIPSVDALAKKHFPEVTDPVQKYCQAVQFVHAKIADSRQFCNYREGQITPAQLRVSARTAHASDLIAETQKGDILIVAAQFGMRHRGRSVRRAREVMNAVEFGLGAFAVGCMLLTHPEREAQWEQLHVDCAGDEFSPRADSGFSYSPYFHFHDGMLKFHTYWVSNTNAFYGSASAFLQQ